MKETDLDKTILGMKTLEEFLKVFGDPKDKHSIIGAELLLEILMGYENESISVPAEKR